MGAWRALLSPFFVLLCRTAAALLQVLEAAGNGLSGSLPGAWSSLSGLQRLNLNSNQLTGAYCVHAATTAATATVIVCMPPLVPCPHCYYARPACVHRVPSKGSAVQWWCSRRAASKATLQAHRRPV